MKSGKIQIDVNAMTIDGAVPSEWPRKFRTLNLYHCFQGFSVIAPGQGCCVITGTWSTRNGFRSAIFPLCYQVEDSGVYEPNCPGGWFVPFLLIEGGYGDLNEADVLEELLRFSRISKDDLKLVDSRLAVAGSSVEEEKPMTNLEELQAILDRLKEMQQAYGGRDGSSPMRLLVDTIIRTQPKAFAASTLRAISERIERLDEGESE